MIDESHVAVPQLHGQFAGDRSRKDVLVEHGFRLPSALDNRPLQLPEFLERRYSPAVRSIVAAMAIAAALLLFVLPVDWRRGVFALDWRSARRIPWGVLTLFGGGLSLARAMDQSGLAAWIGNGVAARIESGGERLSMDESIALAIGQ